MITKISRNLHRIDVPKRNSKLAILSDLHWDNPKCDRAKLTSHLEYCKKHEIPIFVNGDFFCLMQGKYDPRRSKRDIRPEHNVANYLDAVIEDAVNFFGPYAHLLTVLGYGNHETAIVKNQETDPLQRFVDLLNYTAKTEVHTGGYGGWLIYRMKLYNGSASRNIKYFHGSGGGGIVTKGAINLTRALEAIENMDVFLLGHIHENWCRSDVRDSLEYNKGKRVYEIKQRMVHHAITGTYKEEYSDGAFGWHIERGAPPKPTGGRILTFTAVRKTGDKSNNFDILIDSTKFPV